MLNDHVYDLLHEKMFLEIFGSFPSGYFCFIFDVELIELFVCFGDEIFVGIFVLKLFSYPEFLFIYLFFHLGFPLL